ncbi:MAG: DMT family transporter [Lachnospiraceae bacterium]|nr:DMT family transporter [Lachnospiraceae bacterium]
MTEKYSTKSNSYLMPCFLVLLQGLLYGLGDPISKEAYDVMPVYALLSIRYLLALLLLFLFAGRRIVKGLKGCSPRDWLLPSICMGGAYLAGNIALQLTAATSVAFLRSLSTVMTPLLALLVYKRKLGRKHILIQIMVIFGLYLLCGLGGLSGFGAGELFALLSALLLAGSLVFGENALDRVDSVTLSAMQTSSSVIMAFVCAAVFDGGFHLELVTPKIGGIIVYLSVCCTIAGYVFQNAALAKISSRTVALLQCFCPVMTAFFSFIILGERLALPGVIGACIILGCVAAETIIGD